MLAGAIGVQALFGGLLHTAFGAYVLPLQDEFGWTRTMLSGAYSLQQIETGLFGPVLGWLIGRYGPRNAVRSGLLIAALGFWLFSNVQSLPVFYLSFLVLSFGSYLAGYLSVVTAVVSWFEHRPATAIGLMSAGMSIGGLMAPLVALSLTTNGWRMTALASGVIVLVIGLPVSQILRVKGAGRTTQLAANGAPATDRPADFTAREALRSPTFWFIAFGHSCGALLFASLAVHLVSAVTSTFQVSLEVGALATSLVTGMTLVGQVAGGPVGDRYDKRIICVIAMTGMTIGIGLLAAATEVWMIVLFAILYGISLGARGPIMVAMRAEYFGKTAFATILGFSMSIATVGTVLGPLIVGWLADQTGSYRPGFAVLTVLAALGTISFWLAKPPRRVKSEE